MAFRHSDPNFKRRAPYPSMSTASPSIIAAAHAAHKRSMSRFTTPAGGHSLPSSHTASGAFLPDIALKAAEMAFDKQMIRERQHHDHRHGGHGSSHTRDSNGGSGHGHDRHSAHSAPATGRSLDDARSGMVTANAAAVAAITSGPSLPSDHPSSLAAAAAKISTKDATTNAQHNAFTAELEDELAQVRDELRRKEEFVRGIQRNYETLSTLCSRNVQEMRDMRAKRDIDERQMREYEDQNKKFAEWQKKVQPQLQENAALKDKNLEIEAKCTALDKKVTYITTINGELANAKTELLGQLTRLQTSLSSRQEEVDELRRALKSDEMKKVLFDEKQKYKELERQYGELQAEMERLKNGLRATELTLTKTANQLRRAESDRDNIGVDVHRLRNGTDGLKQENIKMKQEAVILQQRCESLELDQQRLQSKLKLVERTIPEIEDRLAFSEKTREHLRGQLEATLLSKLDAENGARIIADELTRLRDTHKLAVTGYQRDHETTQDRLRSTNKERESADAKRVEAEEQARVIEKQLESLRRDIGDMKARESSFLNNIKWLEEQLEENQRQNSKMLADAAAQDHTERLSTELARLQDSHAALKKSNHEQALQITELLQKHHRLENDLATRQADSATSNRSRIALDERVSQLTKNVNDLNRQLLWEQQRNQDLVNAANEAPQLSRDDIVKLRMQQKELHVTVAKLIISEEASEAAFTCISCLNVYTKPVTCIPCGHSYCLSCITTANHCQQCGRSVAVTWYANELLADLTARYLFRKQALAALRLMASTGSIKLPTLGSSASTAGLVTNASTIAATASAVSGRPTTGSATASSATAVASSSSSSSSTTMTASSPIAAVRNNARFEAGA